MQLQTQSQTHTHTHTHTHGLFTHTQNQISPEEELLHQGFCSSSGSAPSSDTVCIALAARNTEKGTKLSVHHIH